MSARIVACPGGHALGPRLRRGARTNPSAQLPHTVVCLDRQDRSPTQQAAFVLNQALPSQIGAHHPWQVPSKALPSRPHHRRTRTAWCRHRDQARTPGTIRRSREDRLVAGCHGCCATRRASHRAAPRHETRHGHRSRSRRSQLSRASVQCLRPRPEPVMLRAKDPRNAPTSPAALKRQIPMLCSRGVPLKAPAESVPPAPRPSWDESARRVCVPAQGPALSPGQTCTGVAVYSSSVTCSSQVTTSPWSSASWMATWAMNRPGVAPCQCSSPGSM
jgi:hypothetical protein